MRECVCVCASARACVRRESMKERENKSNDVSPFQLLCDHVLRLCVAGSAACSLLQTQRGGAEAERRSGFTAHCPAEGESFGPPDSGRTAVCCALIGCVCPLLPLPQLYPSLSLLSLSSSNSTMFRKRNCCREEIFATLAAPLLIPVEEREEDGEKVLG